MSDHTDGGQAALAGYLYQLIGTLGLKAWAHCESVPQDAGDFNALLTVVREAELHHEQMGQDAVLLSDLGIAPEDQCVLIQFKYSRSPESHSITPRELKEITQSFRRSTGLARQLGHDVTGYVLMTNRELTPPAERIASVHDDDIIAKLRMVEIRFTDWIEGLDSFSQQYGCTEAETDHGISRLIGQLIRQTGSGEDVPVAVSDLVQAFTGCAEATKLKAASIAETATAQLDGMRPSLGLRADPVRRSLLTEISRGVAENALVIVAGKGGCGKSVSLWQWALQRASTSSGQTSSLAALLAANQAPSAWIPQLISGWANLPPQHARCVEPPSLALKRLVIANQDVEMPILHLGLDGLDESIDHSEREDSIRSLIDWFWQEDQRAKTRHERHQASLIVTVRDQAEIPEKWLRKIASGFPYEGRSPFTIIADSFTCEELIQAAREALPELVSARLVAAVAPQMAFPSRLPFSSLIPQIAGTDNPLTLSAKAEIVEALQHPAMWGSFLHLRQETQFLVLDGTPPGLKELVDEFSKWFSNKVIVRSHIFHADLVLDVLRSIAGHCVHNMKSEFTDYDWIRPALGTGLVELFGARRLKAEALSAGLISGALTGQWYWQHAFVCEYLVQPPSGSKREGN